jgi:hypothetical protein
MGRLCYPTIAPGSPEYSGWYFSREIVTVQGGYGTLALATSGVFLQSWYKFYCVKPRSRYNVSKWPGIAPGAEI